MAFEDEEAIDTTSGDESAGLDTSRRVPAGEDNSGAAPVIAPPDDNSGAAPVTGAIDTSEQPQEAAGPNGPIARNLKAFPGNVKRIVSYLMGEGAADPASLNQIGAQVDPGGQLNADDRNLLAVQKVAETEGPEAAWKLVQANRVAYNAKQAFAYTALNGTQQKPPDLNAAIDAANKAASHVLDGSSVAFAPAQGGVTATVKAPGSDQPQTYNLSMDAFRRYLNVGGDGQYDRVMQATVPQTLARLSQGGGQGQDRIDQLRPMRPPAAPAAAEPTEPAEIPQTNFGKTPSTMNLSGSTAVQGGRPLPSEETNYGDELEARARRMFPSVSQEAERNAWMAQEEQRQEANQVKIDVARQTGEGRVQAAQAAGGARVEAERERGAAQRDVAGIKTKGWQYASDAKKASAQIAADAKLAHDGNVDARARLETARKAIATKRLTAEPLTPEEKQLEQQMAAGGAASASPTSRQPAPQQAPQQRPQGGSQQPPVQGAKLYKGQWYTRGPNGESVPYQP